MKQSIRAAINAKCADCIGDPCSPASLAVQIELCSARDCPLWAVRPVRKARQISTENLFSNTVREFYGLPEGLDAQWLETRGGQEYSGVRWPTTGESTRRSPKKAAARADHR